MYTTFATCFYPLNSKFSADIYLRWTTHLLENVKEFYLVLFTDEEGEELLTDYFSPYYFKNPNIFLRTNNIYITTNKFCLYRVNECDLVGEFIFGIDLICLGVDPNNCNYNNS